MTPDTAARLAAVRTVAENWADPEDPVRLAAERATLDAPNLFTEASVLFAVNQAMAAISAAQLETRVGQEGGVSDIVLGGATPMAGYAEAVTRYLRGGAFGLVPAESSPALVPAYLRAVEAEAGTSAMNVRAPQALGDASAEMFAIAVVDGREEEADWEGLAEDALLYEGGGVHSTRIILAPSTVRPDALLEACAAFRGFAPVHLDVPGRLALPKAFLAATGTPHAYGDDLEFLISQGGFEPQPAGHIRWVVAERAEAERVLHAHVAQITAVATRDGLSLRTPPELRRQEHGEAHRPSFAESLKRGQRAW